MITLETLEVTSFNFGQRTLNWTVESTTESISDYELNIYRAEFYPQGDVLDQMVLVASGITAESYDWTDYTISGYEYSQHREFYYAAVPTNESTSVQGDYVGPSTVIAQADFIADFVKLEQGIGFRLTGQPLAVLKKKTFGTYCTCYDSTLGRQTESNCEDCYDTGFDGGYYDSIIVSGILNAYPKRQMIMDWGVWEPGDAMMTLQSYPVISPDDVLVDRVNKRWKIITVNPTNKSMSLIIQNCQIRLIPKSDAIYQFTIPDLSGY